MSDAATAARGNRRLLGAPVYSWHFGKQVRGFAPIGILEYRKNGFWDNGELG